jgi:hypothetical protein
MPLNRLTFGPRPGDVAAVEAVGLDKWIDEQLNPETIDDSAFEARLAAYPAMRLSQHELVERFPSPAMIRQAEQGKRGIPWNPVEKAIYNDQIAQLRERQEKKQQQAAAGQGTGLRVPASREWRAPNGDGSARSGTKHGCCAPANSMMANPNVGHGAASGSRHVADGCCEAGSAAD